jgi:hypothetical protein
MRASRSHRRDLLTIRRSVPQTQDGIAQLLAEALTEAIGRPREKARTLIQAALRIALDLAHQAADRTDHPCCLAPDCDCEPDIGQLLCPGHLIEAIEREEAAKARWPQTARALDAARALTEAVEARPLPALPGPARAALRADGGMYCKTCREPLDLVHYGPCACRRLPIAA